MEESNSKLHFLLLRQLKRSNLTEEDVLSNKREQWNDLLLSVSRAYSEYEQDRYLLERSMEISSRELMELNEKLEYAQQIAHLGYWLYDREEKKLTWSKEMFCLAGIDPSGGEPNLTEVMELVHMDDRPELTALIERAFSEGKEYEIELQFKNKKEDKYYWLYAKGSPHIELKGSSEHQSIRYLAGIAMDITDRKKSEENIKKIHQQLLSISRQAGMAEVATSILHNIGNILNSANVSISLVRDLISKSRMNKLISLSQIIKEHITNRDDYLANDQNGKLVPDYLVALTKTISEEYNHISAEVSNIDIHLEHIKDIVAMQKDISGVSGINENICLSELIDLAIQMSCYSNESKNIEIIKKYNYEKSIFTEKAKLLQILVNLLRNARDAIMSFQNRDHRKIIIFLRKLEDKPYVEIVIKDNGVGIKKEDLTRIFSLGFTTKPNGHGFGLHSSAIAAIELGGSLRVESNGVGEGAAFIIELPLRNEYFEETNVKEINEKQNI